MFIYAYVPFPCNFFQGLSLALRFLAGSTRQQTVGRINQVADRGDGDEDEDKDEQDQGDLCRSPEV